MSDATSPDAIDLLTDQHREVEEIFSDLEQATDPDEKQALFETLADKLIVHTKLEELIFYRAVTDRKTEDMVLESFTQHTSVKRLLADLLDADPADATFDAQVKLLQEQVQLHVEQEEGNLFPAAKKVLEADELMALAHEMGSLQAELEDDDPGTALPEEPQIQSTR